jgi:hypothetical protein
VYAFSSDKQVKQNLEPTHVQPAISSPKFDKTETLLAAVLLGGEEKPEDFFLICVVRGLLGPLMTWKTFGVAEDRTGGLGPAKRKEHYLTAAPFHQFDGISAILRQYNTRVSFSFTCHGL